MGGNVSGARISVKFRQLQTSKAPLNRGNKTNQRSLETAGNKHGAAVLSFYALLYQK